MSFVVIKSKKATDKTAEKSQLVADVKTKERATEVAKGYARKAGAFIKTKDGDFITQDNKYEIVDKQILKDTFDTL